jgi:hypothetical protein
MAKREVTVKDYQRLWKNVTNTTDEGKAIRILAEILADKEGRAFISRLERKDAELCIEMLDHVSRDPYLLLPPRSELVFFRASQSPTSPGPRRTPSLLR